MIAVTPEALSNEVEAKGSMLRSLLPPALHTPTMLHTELWQWLAAAVLLALCAALAFAITWALIKLVKVFSRRSVATWSDELKPHLTGPVRLLLFGGLVKAGLPLLVLPDDLQRVISIALSVIIAIGVFWALYRAITVGSSRVLSSSWAKGRPGTNAIISLGVGVARAALVALAVISSLNALGYPVTSLLAGLGLGGLAFALAAQKTVENLFGAFALAVDQPFREGDFVKVDDFVGTVERIGMRSTRFRTLDRTLISIPNSKLADGRLESYTARDRLRFACTVSLVYQTTAAQMRQVLEGVEARLRQHPKIWPDGVTVSFKELGASSLDIEVMAWFQTIDANEFQQIRQGLLLQLMEVVESAGTSFAYPTRTVHLFGRAAPGVRSPLGETQTSSSVS